MKKFIYVLSILILGACAAPQMVISSTKDTSGVAPSTEVTQVKIWATSCQALAVAEMAAVSYRQQGRINAATWANVQAAALSVEPICTMSPTTTTTQSELDAVIAATAKINQTMKGN